MSPCRRPVAMLVIVLVTGTLAACGGGSEVTTAPTSPATGVPTPLSPATGIPTAASPTAEVPTPAAPTAAVGTVAPPVEGGVPAAGDGIRAVYDGLRAVLGRGDVAAALGAVGPFPPEIPAPADAVLAGVTLTNRDARVTIADTPRPIISENDGLATSRESFEALEAFYRAELPAVGWETPSLTTATNDAGDRALEGQFRRVGSSPEDAETEVLVLTVLDLVGQDVREIQLSYRIEGQGAGALDDFVSGWSAGLPIPDGYRVQQHRVSVVPAEPPRISFRTMLRNGATGQAVALANDLFGRFPVGGYELAPAAEVRTDTSIGFPIVSPGLGDGRVATRDEDDHTQLTYEITADVPAS